MQGDDPPYLSVGTAVSAKYKGAFCEAKVSKVVRIVKCKVTYKMGLGNATVNDEQVKGPLRVGQLVQAKHPDRKEFIDATITKIQDCSQYTVVFDDGDITTLRRTALCLKSGRHFNESETLDQLPLTHPEHFGNPVMGGRRGRRSRQLKEDSSEGEVEEENEPDLEQYSVDTGKVVSVEASDKKRSKDNWFPGLIVMPSAQPTVRINVKDEFLVRSFKDGRYYTVPKKEVNEFKREMGARVESSTLSEAVDKAIKFLDNDELPVHWERNSLFNVQSQYSDSDENFSDSSDDEPTEEKDHFVAQLYKFMDDSGTPLNKTPMISNKDVDFYRLFRLVHKLGGYNRVTNQNKWKTIAIRLKFSQSQNTYNQVKQVYKKCLLSYESFYRTLGCTMLNHTRNAKKNRGRNLIRDKDRVTPVQSPRPERDEEELKKEDEKEKEVIKEKDKKKKVLEEEKKESGESSSELTDHSSEQPSTSKESVKPKKVTEVKALKEKKRTSSVTEKSKVEETKKEKEEEKEKEKEKASMQQTRSKTNISKSKEVVSPESNVRETRTPVKETIPKVIAKSVPKKVVEEDKKRGRKRINTDDKTSNSDCSVNEPSTITQPSTSIPSSQTHVNIGDKLKVYYGPTHESKVTYEAKVIDVDNEPAPHTAFLVHYTGWNTRYDEWITIGRIAENLSATTKAKRLKQGGAGAKGSKPLPGKRGRGMSITGRSTIPEAPRSSTPSSVTSSSSRTKSPATPASRSGNRSTRQGDTTTRRTRRTSAQTDISIHSESESDEQSESDTELTRTRSGSKTEEIEPKTYRRKLVKTKGDKRKDDEDTEKEEEPERPKRARKLKKTSEVTPPEDSDDDSSSQPKGREFDLNQIRSELKGFGKAIKVPSTESSEKENASSDSESTVVDVKESVEAEVEDKKDKEKEDKSSSDDIYEFKEPEPFEFEARKSDGDKGKKRIPRLFEDLEKTPPKKQSPNQEVKKFGAKKSLIKKDEEVLSPERKEEKSLEDPFDMLVVSPSFQNAKTSKETSIVEKPVLKMRMFEPQEEDSDDRMGLSSDNDEIFTRTSSPSNSPERNESKEEVKVCKDSEDDEDPIRASIQRVIEQSSLNDEDSADLLEQTTPTPFEVKSPEPKTSVAVIINRVESEDGVKEEVIEEKEKEKERIVLLPKQIASVFQETDSSFLEDLCSSKPQFNTKVDDIKELSVKTGTRIADTILQKLIKNKSPSPEPEVKEEEPPVEVKKEEPVEVKEEPAVSTPPSISVIKPEEEIKPEPEVKSKLEVKKPDSPQDFKKRQPSKKFVSREFIEDTESESDSDSEQRLVIARSDDDSQTSISLDNKTEDVIKESDSNITLYPHTEDSQSQEEERNFKFDLPEKSEEPEEVKKEEVCAEEEKNEESEVKEEEPDSQLHSMLLCRETIPGSPAPPPQNEPALTFKPARPKNVLEMPFASAPSSSSNNKNNSMLQQEKSKEKQPSPPPLVIPLDNNKDASAVLDNTPPTTPESTISNLSPRGDVGGLSPNIADNESCKSADADVDYPPSNVRRSICSKVGNYSDDSLTNNDPPTNTKRTREEIPSPCKKRRRSCKGDSDVPTRRGRKPNRSRHNSDSDDTSEHSMQGINNLETRLTRSSPRPSKYNFFVELDPALDSAARIAVLQQKLQDLRKTYADVKAELVTIERRRKKIRRREREALKAAKQEMACT